MGYGHNRKRQMVHTMDCIPDACEIAGIVLGPKRRPMDDGPTIEVPPAMEAIRQAIREKQLKGDIVNGRPRIIQ